MTLASFLFTKSAFITENKADKKAAIKATIIPVENLEATLKIIAIPIKVNIDKITS